MSEILHLAVPQKPLLAYMTMMMDVRTYECVK